MASVRDSFLSECCKRKIAVTIIVQNGFQLKGVVADFDESAVAFLAFDGKQMIISPHAISTIIPHSPIFTPLDRL